MNIENPEFEKAGKAHDWRNYVPFEWQNNWSQLTERERKIIAIMAGYQADTEDWD